MANLTVQLEREILELGRARQDKLREKANLEQQKVDLGKEIQKSKEMQKKQKKEAGQLKDRERELSKQFNDLIDELLETDRNIENFSEQLKNLPKA